MTPPPLSASCLSFFVSTLVSKHDSVSTQTPAYAKPMFCLSCSCFSSASFVAMCWVRLCPRCFHCGAHDWFALSFLHFLHSYASYMWPVNPLAFVQNTIYTRNLSMYSLFQEPWFTHCFGLNSSPGLSKHHAECQSASSY